MVCAQFWKIPVSKTLAAASLLFAAGVVCAADEPFPTAPPAGYEAHGLKRDARHGEALPFLRQALEISRRSFGLYHENQLSILESLIESEVAGANWRRVDDLHALLLHLYGKLYADDAGRMEQGLEKVTRWHVDALHLNLDDRTVPHLRQARKLFKARLQLALEAALPDARKIAHLREGVRIAEAQLILRSDGHSEEQRNRAAMHRATLLSSLD